MNHLDRRLRARALLFSVGCSVLPVDDEVSRVVHRLTESSDAALATRAQARLTGTARARRQARAWLTATLPRELDAYREAITYLRHHAQHTCLAVGPHCHVCPLASRCSASGRLASPVAEL